MEPKKLYKNRNHSMICGVCAGLADYTGIDVTVVRLLTVLLGITSIGVILYIVAAIIMPDQPQY